jgi:Mn2+/Fe2+ NRAMP family transporter
VILVFILILASRRSLLGSATNGRVFQVVATISIVAVSTMSAIVVFDTILPWFGIST